MHGASTSGGPIHDLRHGHYKSELRHLKNVIPRNVVQEVEVPVVKSELFEACMERRQVTL
jgi:hypothetical protein